MSRGDIKPTGESDPLDLFHSGIRTQTTDATYTTILRIVLCAICEDVLSGTFEGEGARAGGARAQGSRVGARPHARHLEPAAQEDGAAADGRQLSGPVVDCQLLCPAEEAAGHERHRRPVEPHIRRVPAKGAHCRHPRLAPGGDTEDAEARARHQAPRGDTDDCELRRARRRAGAWTGAT